MPDLKKILLSPQDLGYMLSLTPKKVLALARYGHVPKPIKFGNETRWIAEEVYQFFEKLRNPPVEAEAKNPDVAVDLPSELASLAGQLLEFDSTEDPCVYFLIEEGRVVYVGQTGHLAYRTATHRKGGRGATPKVFGRVVYLRMPREQLDAAEKFYIKELKPDLNITHNFTKMFTIPEEPSSDWDAPTDK